MGRHPKFLEDAGYKICLVCQEIFETVSDNQVICKKEKCKLAYDRIKKHILRNNQKFK